MTAPLTLIVEGKPLVFDVPVPVGEVIPAGSWYCWNHPDDGNRGIAYAAIDATTFAHDLTYFTARPPVAPESFADGDVAWVRVERDSTEDDIWWWDSNGNETARDGDIRGWVSRGHAYLIPSPRPESLADVLDDLGLTDEQRARVEKAVGEA